MLYIISNVILFTVFNVSIFLPFRALFSRCLGKMQFGVDDATYRSKGGKWTGLRAFI